MTPTGWNFDGELPTAREDPDRQGPPAEGPTLHEIVRAEPEFRQLRRRMRGFAFPMAAAFLLWYIAFVLLASYARDLMATPVLGAINLGLVIGLAQFGTTFALTAGYVRYARRHLDPLADQIRDRVEGAAAAAPAASAPRAVVDRPIEHHPVVDMTARQRVADGSHESTRMVDAPIGGAR